MRAFFDATVFELHRIVDGGVSVGFLLVTGRMLRCAGVEEIGSATSGVDYDDRMMPATAGPIPPLAVQRHDSCR